MTHEPDFTNTEFRALLHMGLAGLAERGALRPVRRRFTRWVCKADKAQRLAAMYGQPAPPPMKPWRPPSRVVKVGRTRLPISVYVTLALHFSKDERFLNSAVARPRRVNGTTTDWTFPDGSKARVRRHGFRGILGASASGRCAVI
jgi:hypothetical protein